MVSLGSLQPATFQTFHGAASAYDDALSFCSFELALNDVADMATTASVDNAAEEVVHTKPARRGSVQALAPLPPPDRSGTERAAEAAGRSNSSSIRRNAYTQSSAPHRLFRAAKPEMKSWNPHAATSDDAAAAVVENNTAVDSARSRAASWHTAAAEGSRSSAAHGTIQQQSRPVGSVGVSHGLSPRRSPRDGRGSRDDSRPSNEVPFAVYCMSLVCGVVWCDYKSGGVLAKGVCPSLVFGVAAVFLYIASQVWILV